MWTETFKASGIYDFDYVLRRLANNPLRKLDIDERWVEVPYPVDGEHLVIRVQARGSLVNPLFTVTADSSNYRDAMMDFVLQLFQWDKNLEEIQNHFLNTNLRDLFLAFPGTPIVKEFHLYDSLIKAIIHQQLNRKFAYTLESRFIQAFGSVKNDVWFYPKPEDIASLPYESLRKLQFSQRKAEYVIDTSLLIAKSELDLAALSMQPDDQIIDTLIKNRGIGKWTAENWLLAGLGRENLLPVADIGIQNAIKQYKKLETKPTPEQIKSYSKDWPPYKSFASLTLWRSLEEQKKY